MNPENIQLIVGDWQTLSAQAAPVRTEVFVREQGIDPSLEWDEFDLTSLHCVATHEGRAVGTGRFLPDGHIGRMAVLASYRRHGVGALILLRLIEAARERGVLQIELSAQSYVTGFYSRYGFKPQGEEYEEVGIPHQRMILAP